MFYLITGISLSAIAHSTEVIERVGEAMLNLVPEELRGGADICSVSARGHHGNQIMILSMEEHDRKRAGQTVGYIMRLLPMGDKLRIRDRIHMFYDGRSTLFLRVDKQLAYQGVIRLSDSDDIIRIKIGVSVRKGDLSSVLDALELE